MSDVRVTKEMIESKIDSEMYIRTPEQGLTVCKLQMKNGFVFIGKSACVDPANYEREIGDKIAYEDAFSQVWSHEGYLLKEFLHGAALLKADADHTAAEPVEEQDIDLQANLGQKAHG